MKFNKLVINETIHELDQLNHNETGKIEMTREEESKKDQSKGRKTFLIRRR